MESRRDARVVQRRGRAAAHALAWHGCASSDSRRSYSSGARTTRRAKVRYALALALLAGCREKSDTELKCLANDPSMDAARCYSGAEAAGYDHGLESGGFRGYSAGYDQCEADLDTGDTGGGDDTGG